jgi:hypothetical protein
VNNTTEQLTREQILAMSAGMEIDTLIAERVMGYTRETDAYSTDVADAWDVVCKLKSMGWRCYVRDLPDDGIFTAGTACEFQKGDCRGKSTDHVEASSVPLAICRAALLAIL